MSRIKIFSTFKDEERQEIEDLYFFEESSIHDFDDTGRYKIEVEIDGVPLEDILAKEDIDLIAKNLREMNLIKENEDYKKENAELIFEIGDLKNKLKVACHVDRDNPEDFDWDILHRIWDLEDSLERVIDVAESHRNNPYDGIYAIIKLAKRALKRSRGEV